MKKILFPTDFSEVSLNAFVYALQLADKLNAEIVTLHVYELPHLHVGGLPATLKEVYDSIELENFQNMRDSIPLLHQLASRHHKSHIKISNVLQHGDLVWAIGKVCREEFIDIVVMGTKGASGLKETFLGSTTGAVITEVESLVIGVPESCEFDGIENIAFTTRFREKDIRSLRKVLEIARLFNAHVDCLYIKTKNSDLKEVVFEDWKFLFRDEDVSFHIIESDHVKNAILDFVDTHAVDMLAMLNYKRNFFQELFNQSLTQKLSYHIKVPLLAIHESQLK